MKNPKKLIAIVSIFIFSFSMLAACGKKTEATNGNKTATENKTSSPGSSATSQTSGAASTIVKDIYDNAMSRNCSAIPAKLTEEFRKSVGTSKDSLDALCDTFTDSGKLASFEVKSESLSGDSGTVKVRLVYKDGKKEEKDERVKKSGDKWLMDS